MNENHGKERTLEQGEGEGMGWVVTDTTDVVVQLTDDICHKVEV